MSSANIELQILLKTGQYISIIFDGKCADAFKMLWKIVLHVHCTTWALLFFVFFKDILGFLGYLITSYANFNSDSTYE